MRAGPDDRSATIQVSLPAGSPGCAQDPRIEQLTEENDMVYANVVFTQVASTGCAGRVSAEVVLRTPGPLGERDLALNGLDTWGRAGAVYVL